MMVYALAHKKENLLQGVGEVFRVNRTFSDACSFLIPLEVLLAPASLALWIFMPDSC